MYKKSEVYILDAYLIANRMNEEKGIDEWDTGNPDYLSEEDIIDVLVCDEKDTTYIGVYTHCVEIHFGRGYIKDIEAFHKYGIIKTDELRDYYARRKQVLEWLVKNFISSDLNRVFLRING